MLTESLDIAINVVLRYFSVILYTSLLVGGVLILVRLVDWKALASKGIKQSLPIVIVIGILSLILTGCAFALLDSVSLIRQQEKLANELSVDLNRWPYVTSFPASYYASTLEEGMTRRQVHEAIKGYERVFKCGPDTRGFTEEIYYFYSSNDDTALRMQIVYDNQKRYFRTQGEDRNSRTITTTNCQVGQWDE